MQTSTRPKTTGHEQDVEGIRERGLCPSLFCRFVLVTPAVMRVESKENILLEAFGLSEPVTVSLSIYDFPVKARQLWHGTITLNSDNNYSFLQAIKVNYICYMFVPCDLLLIKCNLLGHTPSCGNLIQVGTVSLYLNDVYVVLIEFLV